MKRSEVGERVGPILDEFLTNCITGTALTEHEREGLKVQTLTSISWDTLRLSL